MKLEKRLVFGGVSEVEDRVEAVEDWLPFGPSFVRLSPAGLGLFFLVYLENKLILGGVSEVVGVVLPVRNGFGAGLGTGFGVTLSRNLLEESWEDGGELLSMSGVFGVCDD